MGQVGNLLLVGPRERLAMLRTTDTAAVRPHPSCTRIHCCADANAFTRACYVEDIPPYCPPVSPAVRGAAAAAHGARFSGGAQQWRQPVPHAVTRCARAVGARGRRQGAAGNRNETGLGLGRGMYKVYLTQATIVNNCWEKDLGNIG